MKVKFIKEVYREGRLIKSETLYSWFGDLSPRIALTVCQNFYDGFLLSFDKPYRRPCIPSKQGFEIWSYNFHKDQSGFVYRFVNGKNQTIRFK